MANPDDMQTRRWMLAVAIALALVVTVFHYLTNTSDIEFHNVYRRLYYIPIVLAAFAYGLRGGVGVAVATCLLYTPHAFFMKHGSPSPTIDKVLEMVLYVAIGALTGWLVEQQTAVRRALQRSLTERDALEASLVRAGKLSALGQLTSGLAHEIRNPLASIMGSAEAVVAEIDEDHRKYRMGQVLLNEINRLNAVVSDFLKFARPSPPERRPVALRALTDEVVELTASRARAGEISVSNEVADDAVVEGDPGQLSQVVLNLVLNAYQALEDVSPPQGRELTLLSAHRSIAGGEFTCLGVRDNGPGIDEALRDKIFDPYFTTNQEGTGLGLSISSRIVEAHDGFLEVDCDDGTTFWVSLPEERP